MAFGPAVLARVKDGGIDRGIPWANAFAVARLLSDLRSDDREAGVRWARESWRH